MRQASTEYNEMCAVNPSDILLEQQQPKTNMDSTELSEVSANFDLDFYSPEEEDLKLLL